MNRVCEICGHPATKVITEIIRVPGVGGWTHAEEVKAHLLCLQHYEVFKIVRLAGLERVVENDL